jgi:hypothetical protein
MADAGIVKTHRMCTDRMKPGGIMERLMTKTWDQEAAAALDKKVMDMRARTIEQIAAWLEKQSGGDFSWAAGEVRKMAVNEN